MLMYIVPEGTVREGASSLVCCPMYMEVIQEIGPEAQWCLVKR